MTNSKAKPISCLHSAFLVLIPPLWPKGNMVTPVTCDRFWGVRRKFRITEV